MEVGLEGLGAFLDTAGSHSETKSRAGKEEDSSSDGEEILYDTYDTLLHKDAVENKLESLVFGTQPFAGESHSDTEEDLLDSVRHF